MPVLWDKADTKATLAGKVLKSIWTESKGDAPRWSGALQVSYADCKAAGSGRCSSDSGEDSVSISYDFDVGGGGGILRARAARPKRGARGPRGPQPRYSAVSSSRMMTHTPASPPPLSSKHGSARPPGRWPTR